jgi:hypothetical protein
MTLGARVECLAGDRIVWTGTVVDRATRGDRAWIVETDVPSRNPAMRGRPARYRVGVNGQVLGAGFAAVSIGRVVRLAAHPMETPTSGVAPSPSASSQR